ncbi:MAG: hypothetical protein ABH840_03745 [Nanoarchaeota archaeon]
MPKNEETKKTNKSVINLSYLKINSKVISTFFIDLLFYISFAVLFFIFVFILKSALSNLQQLDYTNILTADINIANTNLAILKGVFVKMILIISLFILSIILSFTLFKGIIWTKLTETKLNLKYFWKTLLMNLIYFAIFLTLIIYSLLKISNNYLTLVLLILFFHFNALSYYFITKKHRNKIFKSIASAFKFSLYIVNYILPYLVIAVLFVALLIITQIILRRIIPFSYYQFTILLFLVFYISIIRNYFSKIVNKIENEN